MTRLGLRLALVALVAIGTACAQTPNASFSLAIDSANKNAKVGSEIQIDIVLTNASDHRIVVVKSGPNAEISGNLIVMRSSTGRVPPFTKLGRATLGREDGMAGSSVQVALEPGQASREQARLHELFELAPDTYTIWVERKDRTTGGVARSNTIALTVTGEHKTASFGMVLNSGRKAYITGSDIPIELILTNDSGHPLQLANAGSKAELGGSYLVVRGTGVRPPRKTPDGWRRLENPAATGEKPEMIILQSGETLKEEVVLNQLFDLPPDKYQVSVERKDKETGIVAQSNVISITVAGDTK